MAANQDELGSNAAGQGRSDTNSRILDVAERLVQLRGFNGFSYADVASELEITKASLHYHYPGKADLGKALIERYASRFIDCRRLRAPSDIARALELKAGDTVVQVRRVLTFRGVPIVLDDIWLPGQQFKGLTAERLSDYRGPMYGLFETEFGVRMIRADYCGDGTSWTVNGRTIDLYDGLGINVDTSAWTFEAEWTPSGAVIP